MCQRYYIAINGVFDITTPFGTQRRRLSSPLKSKGMLSLGNALAREAIDTPKRNQMLAVYLQSDKADNEI